MAALIGRRFLRHSRLPENLINAFYLFFFFCVIVMGTAVVLTEPNSSDKSTENIRSKIIIIKKKPFAESRFMSRDAVNHIRHPAAFNSKPAPE